MLSRNGWLWRVDPAEPRAEGVARIGRRARTLAADGSTLWSLHDHGLLTRLDPFTGAFLAEGSIGASTRHLLVAQGALWATFARPRELVRIEPSGPSIQARVQLPGRAVDLVPFGSDVWALSWEAAVDARARCLPFRAATGSAGAKHLMFGQRPQAAVAVADGILVASSRPGKGAETVIEKFDPGTGKLRLVEARAGWCVDQLAATSEWILATMSIGIHSGATGASLAFGAHVGAGGGDGGGG